MTTLLIEGGHRLEGRVRVEGNKNSALPILAACLLTSEECVLTNMPRILDVEVMARLLADLGAEIDGIGTTTLRVRCREVVRDDPDPTLVGRLRGSVLLLPSLLARRGRACLAPPGGDFPARRSLSTHLEVLTSMGARILPGPGYQLEVPDGFLPASMYLFEASVTGTETAVLAAAAAPGRSEIRHAACEPHVVELCRFLSKLGVPISGAGTSTIRVDGGCKLGSAEYCLWGDYIEAGSWAVVAAITGGAIEVSGARAEDIEVIAAVFERLNLDCRFDGDLFCVERSRPRSPAGPGPAGRRLTTGLWPGFPSDLVSLVTVLATQVDGRTLVHDWLYELRLFALEQLSGMGAELFLCDPHRIIVTGPRRLTGRVLDSRDLRSGMALIAAALAADGESRLVPVETVERGYGQLMNRLQGLGARVERQTA
jgi:UDP-N-acetylglucosamine 1-carboxyvinyltransferase